MNGYRPTFLLGLFCLCLAGLAAPAASADRGSLRVAWSQVIRYEDFDPANARDRLALLARVEAAATEYCDVSMTRLDRQACTRKAVDKTMRDAPAAIGTALATARTERDGVKQAMR